MCNVKYSIRQKYRGIKKTCCNELECKRKYNPFNLLISLHGVFTKDLSSKVLKSQLPHKQNPND